MSEKDFHVTVRVKNARMLRRMRAAGFDTTAAFSRACGVDQVRIGELLSMKRSPLLLTNDWSQAAYSISAALRCEPEDIWPEHIARLRARDGSVSFEASLDEVQALTTPSAERTLGAAALQKMLAILTPRERGIIEQRYGLAGGEATLEDLAQEQGVGRERIRQIEAKALRLLKTKAARMGIGG